MRRHVPPGARPAAVPRASDVLRELSLRARGGLLIGDIVRELRSRATGLFLVLFGGVCMLPVPPPIPLICALVIASVSVSILVGHASVWLPSPLSRHRLEHRRLERLFARLVPHVARLERLCRPRLLLLTERPARGVIGIVILVLALVLMLPIPLGNLPPGLALAVIGIGLLERDGLFIAVGLALSIAALLLTSAVGYGAATAVLVAL